MQVTRFATSWGILAFALCALPNTAQAGNSPPVCTAGGVQIVECNGQGSPTIHMLDIGAVDPDGDPLTFQWNLTGSCLLGNGTIDNPNIEHPTVRFQMFGTCDAECGGIKVDVSDGINPPVSCNLALFIQDTTPPTAVGPADILELEGANGVFCPQQLDTSLTGVPTAMDNCDGNPLITLISEVFTSPVGPPWGTGLECMVDRVWEIEDCAGFTTQVSQNVTVVGPSFFNPATVSTVADIVPGSCPNYVDASGSSSNSLDMTVFGSATFSITQIKARAMTLARIDGVGGSVGPIGVFVGDFGAGDTTPCHTMVADGYGDMMFAFDENQVAEKLQLDQLADGTVVVLRLTGVQWDGQPFTAHDIVLVNN